MLSIERLSHLFVAVVMFNAKEAANYTLSISAFLRGTKSIPLSEAARQSIRMSTAVKHCIVCVKLTMKHDRYYTRTKQVCLK